MGFNVKYLSVFAVKIYVIVRVPIDTPIVFSLNHHRAASDGWISDILCDECSEKFGHVLQLFVDNCTYERSCKCNVNPRHSEIWLPIQFSISLSI